MFKTIFLQSISSLASMLSLALFLPFLYSGWYFFSMWQSCLATQLMKLHAFANFRYIKLILFLNLPAFHIAH